MAYIDGLKKVSFVVDGEKFNAVGGSFRGVPFFVDEYSRSNGGRTISTKRIPFSDDFVHEDLGGKVPEFSMQFFLVGETCDKQRDNLLSVCNEPGPGELVHPWFGKFNARCTAVSFSSGRTDLGYVKGEITFVPESSGDAKSVRTNLASKTKELAEKNRMSAMEQFMADMAAIANAMKSILDKCNAVAGAILDAVLLYQDVMATINEFVAEVGKLKACLETLMKIPADFAARFSNIISTTSEIFGIESSKKDDIENYLKMLKMDDGSTEGGLDSNVSKLFKKLVACNVVEALVECEFSSVEEAVECSDRVSETFEKLISGISDVNEYVSLLDMEATALSYVRENSANIAVVVEKEIDSTVNVLQFVYDTYGNLDNVEDVMSRNCFVDGLFLTPGVVRVLSK